MFLAEISLPKNTCNSQNIPISQASEKTLLVFYFFLIMYGEMMFLAVNILGFLKYISMKAFINLSDPTTEKCCAHKNKKDWRVCK